MSWKPTWYHVIFIIRDPRVTREIIFHQHKMCAHFWRHTSANHHSVRCFCNIYHLNSYLPHFLILIIKLSRQCDFACSWVDNDRYTTTTTIIFFSGYPLQFICHYTVEWVFNLAVLFNTKWVMSMMLIIDLVSGRKEIGGSYVPIKGRKD